MTEASNGLRKALARSQNGTVQSLSEMSADDIVANLSDEQKAELAASLPTPAAAAAEDMPNKKDGCESEASDDEDEDDTPVDGDMSAAADASASDRVKAVAAAVANDDACKGKAAMALQMLADDDFAGLSASGIIKALGNSAAPAAAAADSEDAARAEMKAALATSTNSNIAASGGGSKPGNAQANATNIWDAAIKTVAPSNSAVN